MHLTKTAYLSSFQTKHLVIQTDEKQDKRKKEITIIHQEKDLRSFIIVVPSYYIFAAFLPNLPNHFCTNQAHFCISNLTDTSPADASSYLWFLRHYENISSLPMHYFQPYLKAVHVIRVIEQCCFNSTPDPFNGQRANFILKPPKVIESGTYF